MGVLMIHGLNPFGFKYRRRVTEKNVDLNRNCVMGDKMFEIDNKGYGQLTGLLMPQNKVNYGNLRNRFFHLIAIFKIIQNSFLYLHTSLYLFLNLFNSYFQILNGDLKKLIQYIPR